MNKQSSIISLYDFNLTYACQLVEDVDENLMCVSPGRGLENHPAFTLGHLVSAAALMSKRLGGPYKMISGWEQLFRRKGPGDPRTPEPNVDLYPKKKELLDELRHQHQVVENLIVNLDDKKFLEPAQWRFDNYMPSLGELIYFMCITHESMHLGQLAAWRRAMKLPSALAGL